MYMQKNGRAWDIKAHDKHLSCIIFNVLGQDKPLKCWSLAVFFLTWLQDILSKRHGQRLLSSKNYDCWVSDRETSCLWSTVQSMSQSGVVVAENFTLTSYWLENKWAWTWQELLLGHKVTIKQLSKCRLLLAVYLPIQLSINCTRPMKNIHNKHFVDLLHVYKSTKNITNTKSTN